ncbi:MAG: cutinase family protein, partial [Mycobacterium sp.]
MKGRFVGGVLGAVATASALVSLPLITPVASADPCPDIEVVFARGTSEAPGVGGVGQAFVDALRSQVGNRSVGVYAVNYAASSDFADRNGL